MKLGPFAQCAAQLLDGGYSPVPLRAGTKRPLFDKWDALRKYAMPAADIASLSRRYPGLGLGVAGGFNCLIPIDIDTDDLEIKRAVFSILPRPLVAKKGARGFTAFYWDASGMIEAAKFKRPLGDGKFDMLVEIINTGQTVIPPTVHPDTKKPYRWLTQATLFNTTIDALPQITPGHIEAVANALRPWIPEAKRFEPRPVPDGTSPTSDRRQTAYAKTILERVAKELSGMGPNSGRNHRLFTIGCTVGKYVHHKIISYAEVENALMGACQANGLASEDGIPACKASLASGIRKAVNDALPVLPNRERQAA